MHSNCRRGGWRSLTLSVSVCCCSFLDRIATCLCCSCSWDWWCRCAHGFVLLWPGLWNRSERQRTKPAMGNVNGACNSKRRTCSVESITTVVVVFRISFHVRIRNENHFKSNGKNNFSWEWQCSLSSLFSNSIIVLPCRVIERDYSCTVLLIVTVLPWHFLSYQTLRPINCF